MLNKDERNRQYCICNSKKRKLQDIDSTMFECSGHGPYVMTRTPHGTVTPACRRWYHTSCTPLQMPDGMSFDELNIDELNITCIQCQIIRHY